MPIDWDDLEEDENYWENEGDNNYDDEEPPEEY